MADEENTTDTITDPNNGIESVTFEANGETMTLQGNELHRLSEFSRFKTVKQNCQVKLTDADLLIRGSELVNARTDQEIAVLDFKIQKDLHKEKMAVLAAELNRLHYAILNKWEYRDVDCYEKPLYSQGLMAIIRYDTGETVKTRKLTEDEKQDRLFS